MSLQQIEAQNDAYFGLDDTELEDIRPPPRAAYTAPLAAPARTPAPTRAPAPTPAPVPVPAAAFKAGGKKDRDGRAISSLSRVQVFTPPCSASHYPPCFAGWILASPPKAHPPVFSTAGFCFHLLLKPACSAVRTEGWARQMTASWMTHTAVLCVRIRMGLGKLGLLERRSRRSRVRTGPALHGNVGTRHPGFYTPASVTQKRCLYLPSCVCLNPFQKTRSVLLLIEA